MLQGLVHRGPDDAGIEVGQGAILGATRLAIRGIDSGHQPLVDAASGIVAVCNGEIDNDAELRDWLAARGRPVALGTDVAVLPGLYLELGEAFVERLAGTFALALWDPRGQRLLLARDRAGEKPLFYAERDGMVVFATEVAALARDRDLQLSPDLEALHSYLSAGFFASPTTSLAQIRKVPPAEILTFDAAGKSARRYWRWPLGARPPAPPNADAFERIFRTAVARQSAADVPCGVFLSGGLDSALVAAVARAVHPEKPLRAYTLRFQEASYDEGLFAQRVADRLGIESLSVIVQAHELPGQLRELVSLVGEPLADPAWVPTAMLARRAARDVKLVLTGEGADEAFGGYPTYIGAGLAPTWQRLPPGLRWLLTGLVARWPASDRKVSLSFLLKRFVEGAELQGLERHRSWTASLSPALMERLGCPRVAAPPSCEPGELLDLLQRSDLEGSLADGLLTKADRASMRHALELRAPFLDRDVLEFAATLPVLERVRRLETKVFLKRFARRYLPRAIVMRKKRGLSVPLASWLRGPLQGWARERLGDGRLAAAGVKPAVALELLHEHARRQADHGRALWTLLVLVEWLEWAQDRITPENRDAVLFPVGEVGGRAVKPPLAASYPRASSP